LKIFKRKGRNTWCIYIDRKLVSLGTSNKDVAKQLAKETELQLLRGKLGLICNDCSGHINKPGIAVNVAVPGIDLDQSSKVPVLVFLGKFISWRQEDGKTPHLIEQEKYLLKKWLPFLEEQGIKYLDEISALTGQDFITHIKGLGSAPSTIKTIVGTVEQSLTRAVAWNQIKTNPFRDGGKSLLELPEISGTQCKPRILSNEELALLFTHKKYGQYYEWLFYTGQRAGDVSALVYENIDPDKRELRLWIEKGDRYQTLALHQHLADQVTSRKRSNGPVFPNLFDLDKKKRSDKFKYARVALQKCLTKHGYALVNDEGDKAKLHSLRATAGQHIELSGGNRKDAAKHLGHSSENTIDEYIHQDTRIGNAILDKVPVIKPKGVA